MKELNHKDLLERFDLFLKIKAIQASLADLEEEFVNGVLEDLRKDVDSK